MAKKQEPDYSVPTHHQTSLRLLLAQIGVAQAEAQAGLRAAQEGLSQYVQSLLEERGLDPKLWGISRNLTEFVLLKQEPMGTVEQAEPKANGAAAPSEPVVETPAEAN